MYRTSLLHSEFSKCKFMCTEIYEFSFIAIGVIAVVVSKPSFCRFQANLVFPSKSFISGVLLITHNNCLKSDIGFKTSIGKM